MIEARDRSALTIQDSDEEEPKERKKKESKLIDGRNLSSEILKVHGSAEELSHEVVKLESKKLN